MSGTVTIQVSKRILSMGDSSIPLHNIAHTRIVRPEFNLPMASQISLGLIVMGAFLTAGAPPRFDGDIIWVGAVAVLPFGFVQLCRELYIRYRVRILVIGTSGGSAAALSSTDLSLLRRIAQDITQAIDNPHAEFQFTVREFHIGDRINQYGPNATATRYER
ncbi:DUF6232 family protein [Streptomyces griseoruber]|uniref:Uncharacterized protein n=1 Tax=Streptomyces griseoruber TaxID=1943 RepID=A0A101SM20_9ACTN|nr:DUF6232 family protein [Streptomyces griseoruber]KUN76253.1 hypothetical protein AQJ64_38650 [Streptomyces griseoruber]